MSLRTKPPFMPRSTAALPLAREDWLVTFGITPDRPETGYGYIKRGESLASRIVRAPTPSSRSRTARRPRQYLADGGHDWNGGIFLFRAAAFLRRARGICARDSRRRARGAGQGGNERAADPARRGRLRARPLAPRSTSGDGKSEPGRGRAVSTWAGPTLEAGTRFISSARATLAGNAVGGDAIAIDSNNCLIRSDGPTIVTVGVERPDRRGERGCDPRRAARREPKGKGGARRARRQKDGDEGIVM